MSLILTRNSSYYSQYKYKISVSIVLDSRTHVIGLRSMVLKTGPIKEAKKSGSWFYGLTMVELMVEPVMSLIFN